MILRVCAFLLFLAACGGPHNSGFEAQKVEGIPNGEWKRTGSERHPLAGAWRSGCMVGDNDSSQVETRVYDDRTIIIGFYFSDRRCGVRNFEQVIVIGAVPARTGEGEWELQADEAQIRDVLLIANAGESARSMEKNRSCGTRGWEINRARSVLGSECFAKGTTIGAYRFRQARDPSMLEIRYPRSETGTWMISRF
jgi:hypothetical protein